MFSLFIFKKTAVFIWWEFLSWYTNHFLSKESFLFIYELFNEGSKGWTAKCSDELFQSNCQKDYFWKFKYFIFMKRKNKHHSIWFIYNRCKEIKNRRRTQDQYVFDGSYLFIMNKWIEEEEVDLSDILHIGLTDEEKKEQKVEEKQEIQKPIVFLLNNIHSYSLELPSNIMERRVLFWCGGNVVNIITKGAWKTLFQANSGIYLSSDSQITWIRAH